MGNVDVQTEIVINRPREEVASYAADPTNVRDWYVNISSVEWKIPPPAVVGSQIAFVAHFLGRRLEYTYEIIELVAEEWLVMRTAQGPFPMETSYAWEALSPTSTRMTLRNRGQPQGFAAWMTPLTAFMMRRANQKDLRLLQGILEDESTSEPSEWIQ